IVVGRLHGPAIGAGADLALACDIRVASTAAWIQEAWIRLGLVPALGGGFVLPSLLGASGALEAILTARRIPADECLRTGIFQRLVPPDRLDAEVASLTASIAGAAAAALPALQPPVPGPRAGAPRRPMYRAPLAPSP